MFLLTTYYVASTSKYTYGNAAGNSDLSIADIARSNKDFSILVAAAEKADLVAAIDDPGPYTLFAPNNEAFIALFRKLGISGIDDLTESQLRPILFYHILLGEVMSSEVKSGMVETLNPDAKLEVRVYNTGIQINKKTKVIQADIKAKNGVIHVIDKVLVP
jgi:transforming growth factor-beta-induced protein